uniref:Conserved oligomeric Golgi complex subunit 2 n=1 Tax=Parastrongyloides trichosuri TaxID=131310 RepID=A0A0N4ZNS9_PARTI
MSSLYPSPKQEIDSGQLYCFNKGLFTREEFNVERFINLARHRGTLDEIFVDLRKYLKTVQEDLVELINVEYADFVNLSSSLVSLNDVIERIGENTNNSFNKYTECTFQFKEAANQLTEKRDKLSKCRLEQINLRNKINFIENSKRFIDILENSSIDLSHGQIERFSIYLSDLVNSIEACVELEGENSSMRDYDRVKTYIFMKFTKLITECLKQKFRENNSRDVEGIMSCLEIIGEHNYPMEIISKEIVSPMLDRSFDGKELLNDKLIMCLDKVKDIRSSFLENLEGDSYKLTYLFIDSSLLKGLQETIRNKLATSVLSSDTTLFQKCFYELLQFVKTYPLINENSSLLKPCLNQFNMSIYFKLITQDYSKRLSLELSKTINKQIEDIIINEPNLEYEFEYSQYFSLESSVTLLESFSSISDEKIVLEPLLYKGWTFIVSSFKKYISFLENASELEFEENYKLPLAIISDLQRVEDSIMDLCYGKYRPRLEGLSIEWRYFGNVFNSFFDLLHEKSSIFEKIFIEITKEKLNKYLNQVNDVPKNYRWTKKPMPDSYSQYLTNMVEFFEFFKKDLEIFGLDGEMKNKIINEMKEYIKDTFECLSSNLVKSIQQTFSSLQRFKNREDENASNVSGSSDESKMLKQLELDKNFVNENF